MEPVSQRSKKNPQAGLSLTANPRSADSNLQAKRNTTTNAKPVNAFRVDSGDVSKNPSMNVSMSSQTRGLRAARSSKAEAILESPSMPGGGGTPNSSLQELINKQFQPKDATFGKARHDAQATRALRAGKMTTASDSTRYKNDGTRLKATNAARYQQDSLRLK